jgi:hypothetical protein
VHTWGYSRCAIELPIIRNTSTRRDGGLDPVVERMDSSVPLWTGSCGGSPTAALVRSCLPAPDGACRGVLAIPTPRGASRLPLAIAAREALRPKGVAGDASSVVGWRYASRWGSTVRFRATREREGHSEDSLRLHWVHMGSTRQWRLEHAGRRNHTGGAQPEADTGTRGSGQGHHRTASPARRATCVRVRHALPCLQLRSRSRSPHTPVHAHHGLPRYHRK